jgi:hypothetical protein
MIRDFARSTASSVVTEYALLVFFVGVPLIIVVEGIRLAIQLCYESFDAAINAGGPSIDGM